MRVCPGKCNSYVSDFWDQPFGASLHAFCPICPASLSLLPGIQFANCNLMLKFRHCTFLGLPLRHYELPVHSGRASPAHGDSDVIMRTGASEQFALITRRRQMPRVTQNPFESHSKHLISDMALLQAISQVSSATQPLSDYHKSAHAKSHKNPRHTLRARRPRVRDSKHAPPHPFCRVSCRRDDTITELRDISSITMGCGQSSPAL